MLRAELFHNACRIVLRESRDPWAKTYAQAGLAMSRPDEIKSQAAYLLVNLTTWRGELARNTKKVLRAAMR